MHDLCLWNLIDPTNMYMGENLIGGCKVVYMGAVAV